MSNEESLKLAFRGTEENPAVARRKARAQRTRARALSPVRILIQVLLMPLVTLSLTVSIYIRTSPYERTDALRHLAALAGCDTAQAMGLAPAAKGQIGYHAHNDKNGDGIACESEIQVSALPALPSDPATPAPPQMQGITGAKFIKP